MPVKDTRIVIEAGDLKRNAPLRALAEKERAVAAIACYADGERDLERLIDEELRAANLTIAADARAVLLPLLGGDRRASRNEVRKLALYAHGREAIAREDVVAVVADASALAVDSVLDAAFAGRPRDLDTEFSKAVAAGTAPGTIVFAAQRQIATLHKARLAIEAGASISDQVDAMRTHFSRKGDIEAALRAWTAARLARVMQDFAQAQLDTRLRPALGDVVAHRALLALSLQARRKE